MTKNKNQSTLIFETCDYDHKSETNLTKVKQKK